MPKHKNRNLNVTGHNFRYKIEIIKFKILPKAIERNETSKAKVLSNRKKRQRRRTNKIKCKNK